MEDLKHRNLKFAQLCFGSLTSVLLKKEKKKRLFVSQVDSIINRYPPVFRSVSMVSIGNNP